MEKNHTPRESKDIQKTPWKKKQKNPGKRVRKISEGEVFNTPGSEGSARKTIGLQGSLALGGAVTMHNWGNVLAKPGSERRCNNAKGPRERE